MEEKEIIDLRQKVDDLGSLLVDVGERLLEINSKLEEWIHRELDNPPQEKGGREGIVVKTICKRCGQIYWWFVVLAPDEDFPICPDCNIKTELYTGSDNPPDKGSESREEE